MSDEAAQHGRFRFTPFPGVTQTATVRVRIYNRALSADEVQQLYLSGAPEIVNIKKAVYLTSSNLRVGTNYQLQVSSDLATWTNSGSLFTATTNFWRNTNYWDVDNWDQPFFRLQRVP